ncbi:MAG: SDR family NAD(P)-dependent oxidoreductase [Bacteroidales bacterium]|nr:SDR family NAD(P)-dependent oxidoreductase [Bacteroidales bacterium]
MKTIVVTGASGSMGSVVCETLAAKGWHVIMACRNLAKGQAVLDGILGRVSGASLELRQLDLEKLESVREFAHSLEGTHIDTIFNNAGVINRDFHLTADGYEKTFQVNFLGPALLSSLLCDANPGMHVVSMVSLTCSLTGIPEGYTGDNKEEFSQLGSYARAKLALLLFTLELQRRGAAVVDLSDPGVVDSNMISMGRWFDPLADLLFRPLCSSPAKGARPALNAILGDCVAEGEPHTPHYYAGRKANSVPHRFSSMTNRAAGLSLFELASSL